MMDGPGYMLYIGSPFPFQRVQENGCSYSYLAAVNDAKTIKSTIRTVLSTRKLKYVQYHAMV